MPRTGKGQKIATASGQTYGDAAAQEAAQKAVPLADGTPSVAATPPGAPRPGAAPFNRPTERPTEPVTTHGVYQPPPPEVSIERRVKAASMLPLLEQMSSRRGASPHLRNSVRKLKAFVGDVTELVNQEE